MPDANGILVFSFIGFTTEEVLVSNRTVVDIVMLPDLKTLSEVVVTAMGIKKEEKALGYALSAEHIIQSGNTNFASALYGKAAGVKITTAPGGSGSG